ncbi:MAG: RidA family protein [Firmicutes bacterium]|nr:RidA family protein [Alicyclobacillaceae bacterium]MCL6496104.1 RidA family protein [Bacillota bacterium]
MARRKSIELPNIAHAAPIPMGSRIGNLVFSSGISGQDPDTGQLPDDPEVQARNLFRNIRHFMELAGGTPDDIIRVTLYLREERYREVLNREWVTMFPDPESRPARHALTLPLRGQVLFQAELVAVLE